MKTSTVQITILDWGASFLTETKGMDIAQAGGLLATTEIVGGTLGMLLAGWLSDKLFKSKAHSLKRLVSSHAQMTRTC